MREEPTIIGLSPASWCLAVAVMKGVELCTWRIKKVVRTPLEEDRLLQIREMVLAVCTKYQPTHIAVKLLPATKVSPLLARIFALLRDVALEQSIAIEEYPLDALKTQLVRAKLKSKRLMAHELTSMYPALHHVLPNLTKTKTYYHIRVFEAVAAARVCAQTVLSSQGNLFQVTDHGSSNLYRPEVVPK